LRPRRWRAYDLEGVHGRCEYWNFLSDGDKRLLFRLYQVEFHELLLVLCAGKISRSYVALFRFDPIQYRRRVAAVSIPTRLVCRRSNRRTLKSLASKTPLRATDIMPSLFHTEFDLLRAISLPHRLLQIKQLYCRHDLHSPRTAGRTISPTQITAAPELVFVHLLHPDQVLTVLLLNEHFCREDSRHFCPGPRVIRGG